MKIQARHKLIPAIAMLLIAVICLSSASYAWFTMSKTVTATGMELKVVAPNNLLISNAFAGTYAETTTLTSDFGTGKLLPASSYTGAVVYKTDRTLETYAGAPDVDTTFAATTDALANNTNGYYADFHLYLKTTGTEDVTTQLIADSTTITSDSTMKDAYRIAVLSVNAAETADNQTGYTASALANGSVYNFGRTLAYFATVGNGTETILGPINEAGKSETIAKGVALGDAQLLAADEDLFTVTGATITGGTATSPIYHIVVRVWVEGQDSNCIAAKADANNVAIQIAFKDKTYTG